MQEPWLGELAGVGGSLDVEALQHGGRVPPHQEGDALTVNTRTQESSGTAGTLHQRWLLTHLLSLSEENMSTGSALQCACSSEVKRTTSMIHPRTSLRIHQLPSPLSIFLMEITSWH